MKMNGLEAHIRLNEIAVEIETLAGLILQEGVELAEVESNLTDFKSQLSLGEIILLENEEGAVETIEEATQRLQEDVAELEIEKSDRIKELELLNKTNSKLQSEKAKIETQLQKVNFFVL